MRKTVMLQVVTVLVVLTGWSLAQTQPQIQPAVAIRYAAESGRFYQLQRQEGSDWVNLGQPVKGAGQEVTVYQPAATPSVRYRVVRLKDQWVTVWADEFDSDRLNTAQWSKEENGYGGGNNEKQFYSVDPKYCFVKNGLLNLAVYRDSHTTMDGRVQPYTSARIRTLDRGEWTYGRFEIRAKLPNGAGIWPAIWMLPTESRYGGWAACGEIDIMESRGNRVDETLGTLHFGGFWPENKHVGTSYKFPEKNAAEDFHVYALEWEKDAIRWFVDGVCYQTRTSKEWSSAAAPDSATAPFDQPFHMILNVAVDGNFFNGTGQQASDLPASAFPQVMQVDYVRVYQWAD